MNKLLTTRISNRADLRGYSIVPMLTPFTADGALDEAAARRHVEAMITGGSQGMLTAGTTGESVSMPLAMRVRYATLAIEQARGRAAVFAGVSDNSLEHAVQLARAYVAAGVDALVAHLPSYYPIGAAGMEAWYRALADRVTAPLYLYNIPQTTNHSIPLEVVERLSHHPRIAGIKDSEPNLARQIELAQRFRDRRDFVVFVGMVPAASEAMKAGADGYVPSCGNIAPRLARDLMDKLATGDEAGAAAAQAKVAAVSAIYQQGRNVPQSLAAMKAALSLLGTGGGHLLPPLLRLPDEEWPAIEAGLREQGLLS
ncbi:MAG: dihydrodipicolinate synthase family protein [Opitutaceae bacterium]|nr:dihydrodipicolinate synthase family protein [Cephaloticoccus sp.]MCP5530204.1 dihydrodipicolinate synthase family protein [Opitutaceae bacterium]